MTANALADTLRHDAATIAYTILQIEEPVAQLSRASVPPGQPRLGVDAYAFVPSWRMVPRSEVVSFLVGLSSRALLSPTTTRGQIALLLVDELTGERRKWGEKTLNNFTLGFEELSTQLGLAESSRILLAVQGSVRIYSWSAVHLWTSQFGVQVGWAIAPHRGDPRAEAHFVLHRSDGFWLDGRDDGALRPPLGRSEPPN